MKNIEKLLVLMVHYLQIISNITLLMFLSIKNYLIKIINSSLNSIINNFLSSTQKMLAFFYLITLVILIPHLHLACWYLIDNVDLDRMKLLIQTLLLLDLYFLEDVFNIFLEYLDYICYIFLEYLEICLLYNYILS
jgi:hypothetical protein